MPSRWTSCPLDSAVTDCNAAFFDVANAFHWVIASRHEVLRRQGLPEGRWCLDPDEDLSPGQSEAIDRVYRLYPELKLAKTFDPPEAPGFETTTPRQHGVAQP